MTLRLAQMLSAVALLFTFACSEADKDEDTSSDTDTDTDTDTDADTDTDTDTDTDSDTDTDTDTDTGTDRISSGIRFTVYDHTSDTMLCDTNIELVTTPVTSDCPYCVSEWEVAATVVAEEGTACTDDLYNIRHTFLDPEGTWSQMYAGFAESAFSGYEDLLFIGYGSPTITEWEAVGFDGAASNGNFDIISFAEDGDGLNWDMTRITYDESYAGNECGDVSDATTPPRGDYIETSDAVCSINEHFDLWEATFDAGDLIHVSVDTISPTTAFDPWIALIGPDSCQEGWSDSAFPCSFEPLWGATCPAMEVEIPTAGIYTILVGSIDSCTGSTAEYELRVDASIDPNLILVADGMDKPPAVTMRSIGNIPSSL